MVFECLPTDLQKVLSSPQYLTTEHVRWLTLDLLKVLKYLESLGICHRDLKPANTLLSLKPVSIKVCDFGLARSLRSQPLSSPVKKPVAKAGTGGAVAAAAEAADASDSGAALLSHHKGTPPMAKIQRQLTGE
jgi:mitogen-activated protein kinase 1/3